MTRPLLFAAFALLLFCTTPASAARTGSYNIKISFQDTTRTLSVYVPPDYDSTKAYRLMVGLHGLGDNSSNYRNALISGLQWSIHFPNTIIVCPEAYAPQVDFYDGIGGEAIVDSSMSWAMSTYQIDTSNVILQGFSLGGRAALKYGLEHYTIFKGLLLNTPAVQGVKNALNLQSSFMFDYANASKIPIYITHGQDDIFYTGPIDTTLKQLILNDAHVTYRDVAGMAHSIPVFDSMKDVLTFFDSAALAPKDLNVFEVGVPVRSCDLLVTPTVLLQNTGSTSISSVTLAYSVNGNQGTFTWQGTLAPYAHTIATLPAVTGKEGNNAITVQSVAVDGIPDTLTYNNSASQTFQVETHGQSLPLTEGFENYDFQNTWAVESAGDLQSQFGVDSSTARKGVASLATFNGVLLFDNMGRSESLISPVVDLASLASPALSFDYAFNYLQYTLPQFSGILSDTLEVLISTDCGATWTSLFRKSGADLATFSEPIVNALSLDANIAIPDDSNWRTVTLDLSSFASAQNATLKFNYISGLGGSFYLDDVSIAGPASVSEPRIRSTALAFPNPATDALTVPIEAPATLRLLDLKGSVVYANEVKGTATIDTHDVPTGVYLLQIEAGGVTRSQKVVIGH